MQKETRAFDGDFFAVQRCWDDNRSDGAAGGTKAALHFFSPRAFSSSSFCLEGIITLASFRRMAICQLHWASIGTKNQKR